ncbi:MAG TPA: alpha/beta hydrolase [Solirubrobacteraceae bacterium]|nr:alpha/beta hydrolase [Solirubrobacteraceae bacterium]
MRVENGGVELNVEVEGPADATPVVFLHGVSGCCRTYDFLPPELVEGRRIVRVDLRGHGQSGHAPGTYVIDRYGEDVVAVLRLLDRPAVLVGHSLGGVTAWWVAQHEPQLVTAAFLEDPPLYMGEPAEHERNAAIAVFRANRERAAGWQANGATIDSVAAQLAPAPLGPGRTMGDVMTEDAIAARAEALLLMDPGVLDQAIDRSTLADTDTSSPVAVPMLVLAADDAMAAFPARHEERLARSHPDIDTMRVPGAGHGIHDEREFRAAYVRHLAAFLDRHA